jgi:hypothetical protein
MIFSRNWVGMRCNCQAWQESYPQIDKALNLAKAYQYEYTGLIWKFCPFCGKILEPTNTKITLVFGNVPEKENTI